MKGRAGRESGILLRDRSAAGGHGWPSPGLRAGDKQGGGIWEIRSRLKRDSKRGVMSSSEARQCQLRAAGRPIENTPGFHVPVELKH